MKPEVNMNNNQQNNQPNLTIVRPNYKNFETRRAKLFFALASCELRPRPQRATGRSSVQPRPLRLHRRRRATRCRRCDLPSGWFVTKWVLSPPLANLLYKFANFLAALLVPIGFSAKGTEPGKQFSIAHRRKWFECQYEYLQEIVLA